MATKKNETELMNQSDFAKVVNQAPERIHYMILTGKLKPIIVGKTKFIENSEENRNIAKRKNDGKK